MKHSAKRFAVAACAILALSSSAWACPPEETSADAKSPLTAKTAQTAPQSTPSDSKMAHKAAEAPRATKAIAR